MIAGLRTLREHATSYGDAQAEMLPYNIIVDDRDDIKHVVFLIMHPLLCGLVIKMLCVQEPHEVFPESYDLEDAEELAQYEREVRVGDPKAFSGPEDRLELWCDEAAMVFNTILSNSHILNMHGFHPVTACPHTSETVVSSPALALEDFKPAQLGSHHTPCLPSYRGTRPAGVL